MALAKTVIARSASRPLENDHRFGGCPIHSELVHRRVFWRGVPRSERLRVRKLQNDYSRRVPVPFNHLRRRGTEGLAPVFLERGAEFFTVLLSLVLIMPIDLEECIRRHSGFRGWTSTVSYTVLLRVRRECGVMCEGRPRRPLELHVAEPGKLGQSAAMNLALIGSERCKEDCSPLSPGRSISRGSTRQSNQRLQAHTIGACLRPVRPPSREANLRAQSGLSNRGRSFPSTLCAFFGGCFKKVNHETQCSHRSHHRTHDYQSRRNSR
jgi:hypothetical protein